MAALATNSVTFADAVSGNLSHDDVTSGDTQVTEIIAFVDRHAGWMEIADLSSSLRRIVGEDKLAVVLGVELDDLGNLISQFNNWGDIK